MSEPYSYSDTQSDPGALSTYFRATKTATWGFLMALPLLLLYEVGVIWVNRGRTEGIRISVDIFLKDLFSTIGLTQGWMLLGIVLIIGIGLMIWERKKQVVYSLRYPGLMILESTVYAVVLGFFVSGVTQLILSPLMSPQGEEGFGLPMELVLSIGAGIYEELFFRVLLVGGFFLMLRLVFPRKRKSAYVIAAVIGALCFSAVHHLGSYGDPWTLDVFLFRTIFGLVFNIVFLIRGFGIVAWSHALYDVMVFVGFFSLF